MLSASTTLKRSIMCRAVLWKDPPDMPSPPASPTIHVLSRRVVDTASQCLLLSSWRLRHPGRHLVPRHVRFPEFEAFVVEDLHVVVEAPVKRHPDRPRPGEHFRIFD